jgi:hypothetical protein
VLLVLLAIEGATIPFLRPLLSVHVFVGMLLIPPVALKLASTGYRFVRYYARGEEYVVKGPPAPLMRLVVAPILVASTVTLFGTGVLMLVEGPPGGMLKGLHKASFIVWFGAMTIHVLAYAWRALGLVRSDAAERRNRGRSVRVTAVVSALLAGAVLALSTFPLEHAWRHRHDDERRGGDAARSLG